MIEQYLPLITILALAIFVGFFVILLGSAFGPRRPTTRKAAPYESGMVPYGSGRRRVSIRYYLIAVLFILFDIEVIFLYPWAVVFRQLGVFGLVEMAIFLGILLVGYIYVWRVGALEWQ